MERTVYTGAYREFGPFAFVETADHDIGDGVPLESEWSDEPTNVTGAPDGCRDE